MIAREEQQNALLGGVLGAGAALIAAQPAYQGWKRLPMSSVAGGLLEDSLRRAAQAFDRGPVLLPYAQRAPEIVGARGVGRIRGGGLPQIVERDTWRRHDGHAASDLT